MLHSHASTQLALHSLLHLILISGYVRTVCWIQSSKYFMCSFPHGTELCGPGLDSVKHKARGTERDWQRLESSPLDGSGDWTLTVFISFTVFPRNKEPDSFCLYCPMCICSRGQVPLCSLWNEEYLLIKFRFCFILLWTENVWQWLDVSLNWHCSLGICQL